MSGLETLVPSTSRATNCRRNRAMTANSYALAGCATTGDHVILGPEVSGPDGWHDYAASYPTDPDCHPSPQL